MRARSLAIGIAIVGLTWAACARDTPPPRSATAPPLTPVIVVTGADLRAGAKVTGPVPAMPKIHEAPAGGQLEVSGAQGVAPDYVRNTFNPAIAAVRQCVDGSSPETSPLRTVGTSGTLNVWIGAKPASGGKLEVRVEPGTSIDPRARECATQALRNYYLENTGAFEGAPQIPPSGFTSQLTIWW